MKAAVLALMLAGTPALAEELTLGRLEQYTENRGWNEAGLGPTFQLIVMASVTPPGYPTLVYAERNDARSAPVDTPGLANAWQVPLLADLRVAPAGAQPRLSWTLPQLNGRRIERIRVAVRGEPRVVGRFMRVLFTSDDLPPHATGFTVPPGVLAPGARYVFQVMLDDLQGGELRNRSSTFSDPYTYR